MRAHGAHFVGLAFRRMIDQSILVLVGVEQCNEPMVVQTEAEMTSPEALVTRQRIIETERLIRPYIRWTPVIKVDASDFGLPAAPLLLNWS